jgi:hypothetical protein
LPPPMKPRPVGSWPPMTLPDRSATASSPLPSAEAGQAMLVALTAFLAPYRS